MLTPLITNAAIYKFWRSPLTGFQNDMPRSFPAKNVINRKRKPRQLKSLEHLLTSLRSYYHSRSVKKKKNISVIYAAIMTTVLRLFRIITRYKINLKGVNVVRCKRWRQRIYTLNDSHSALFHFDRQTWINYFLLSCWHKWLISFFSRTQHKLKCHQI